MHRHITSTPCASLLRNVLIYISRKDKSAWTYLTCIKKRNTGFLLLQISVTRLFTLYLYFYLITLHNIDYKYIILNFKSFYNFNSFRTHNDISRRRKPALYAVRRRITAHDLYLWFTHDDYTRLFIQCPSTARSRKWLAHFRALGICIRI